MANIAVNDTLAIRSAAAGGQPSAMILRPGTACKRQLKHTGLLGALKHGGYYNTCSNTNLQNTEHGLSHLASLSLPTLSIFQCSKCCIHYRGADKSLARPGRKQATATEDFDVHISYLKP